MAIVYQRDKRSNVTYVYESQSFYSKEKKQSRSKRKLIGRLDPESGQIIPTRHRKSASSIDTEAQTSRKAETNADLKQQLNQAKKEISILRAQITDLNNRLLLSQIEIRDRKKEKAELIQELRTVLNHAET